MNAITALLEAPQSHAVLREILPSVGNLIHDKAEAVRLAVVRMLIRIKTIPNMKYYHIVPLDHLGARFAEEGRGNRTNPVASALTSLMVNSYFPQGPHVESREQIRRALKFLTDDPDAAAVFYANVSKYCPVNSVAQLMVQLLRCLHSAVAEQVKRESILARATIGKRRRFAGGNDDEEEQDEVDDESEPPPTDVMAGLAETVCTLLQSIQPDLIGNAEWDQFLLDEFSGQKLTTILSYYEKKASLSEEGDTRDDCHRICTSILRCAGMLPSKVADGLVPYISTMLASAQDPEDSDSPVESATAYIALLCLWGMTDEVAPSLAKSISSGFGENTLLDSAASDSKKRRSRTPRTSAAFFVLPHLPCHVALSVLGGILRGSDPSSVAAREAILRSQTARSAIEQALEQGTRCAEQMLDGLSVSNKIFPPAVNLSVLI